MDNQHRKMTGYRDLTPEEVALKNEITAKGAELGALCARLLALTPRNQTDIEAEADGRLGKVTQNGMHLAAPGAVWVDPRWLAIGQTDLQKGLMAITRAVLRPESF